MQLGRLGVVSAAAQAVGMSVKSAYALRQRTGGASFAAAWEQAVEQGRGHTLDLAIARAITGTAVPIVYRGRRVGTRQVFDNRLLIAVLRAMPQSASHGMSLPDALAALDDRPAKRGR